VSEASWSLQNVGSFRASAPSRCTRRAIRRMAIPGPPASGLHSFPCRPRRKFFANGHRVHIDTASDEIVAAERLVG
jgi:hypothetical protein